MNSIHADAAIPKEALVTAACEKAFVDFLYAKLGLVIKKHQLKSLHDAIYAGCRCYGYVSWQDYFAALKYGSNVSPEMEQLIAGVTVGESYFFRDQNQIAWLRDIWLPQIIEQRRKQGDRSLRIWSAGCSNGQELYTLAMLLAEALPDLDAWNIHLLGTDINADALSNALTGHYSSWSFRATPDAVRDRYFSGQHNGYTINDDLRHMACFTYLNLADDEFPSMLSQTNTMDLILCRNVFIYFDKAVVDRVMQRFSRCLLPGGVLMLGASDMIATSLDSLRLIQHESIFYYHNSSAQRCGAAEINKHNIVPIRQEKPHVAAVADTVVAAQASASDTLLELLHDGRWHEALALTEMMINRQGRTATLLQHQAKVIANLGDLQTAHALCAECLALDPLDKHSYFLSAMVSLEIGDDLAAEASLRKTIYLDAMFVEAHFQLGMLLIKHDKAVAGNRALNNALKLAKDAPADGELHHAAGMTFQRFIEILEHEMEMYAGDEQVNSNG